MRRIPAYLAAALLLLGAGAPRAAATAPSDEEGLFARLHALDEREMALGRLAQTKAWSALTRRFGDRLERDHDEADARLLRRAQARGLSVLERGAPEDERREQASLQSLSGASFDRALADAVARDEAGAAALLRSLSAMTQDAGTKREARRLLPLIDEKRTLALFLQGRVQGGS